MVTATQTLVLVDLGSRAARRRFPSRPVRRSAPSRAATSTNELEPLAAIDAALEASADADDALRETVRILAAQPGISWAAIAFVETTGLVLGPSAGTPDEARRTLVTVCYKDETVGELQVDGDADRAFLEAVADRISRARPPRLGHGGRGLGAVTDLPKRPRMPARPPGSPDGRGAASPPPHAL